MGHSNGNSFDAQNDYGIVTGDAARRPVPPWKFGISQAAMMTGAR